MMRQICKQMLTIQPRWHIVLFCVLALGLARPGFSATSSFNSLIVTDPLSGVANGGYDPVSYFTDTEPLAGRPEFEYDWNGVPWYFANPANRDIFRRSPEIYAPLFGGHGAMGLARGYISDGNPRIYAILGNRLFLFYSTGNRDAFLLSQKSAYAKANENWEFFALELNTLSTRDLNLSPR